MRGLGRLGRKHHCHLTKREVSMTEVGALHVTFWLVSTILSLPVWWCFLTKSPGVLLQSLSFTIKTTMFYIVVLPCFCDNTTIFQPCFDHRNHHVSPFSPIFPIFFPIFSWLHPPFLPLPPASPLFFARWSWTRTPRWTTPAASRPIAGPGTTIATTWAARRDRSPARRLGSFKMSLTHFLDLGWWVGA